jgi:hypothetical protein
MTHKSEEDKDAAIDNLAAFMRQSSYLDQPIIALAPEGALPEPTNLQIETRVILAIAKWLGTAGVPMKAITAGSGFAWKNPTLALFEEQFESFPAHIGLGRTCDFTAMSAFDLFGDKFRNLSCCKEYLASAQNMDLNNVWYAMVFSGQAGGRDRSLFVLHNRQVTEEYIQADDKHDTKISRRFNGKELSLVLEPLSSFLRSTGRLWYEHLIP